MQGRWLSMYMLALALCAASARAADLEPVASAAAGQAHARAVGARAAKAGAIGRVYENRLNYAEVVLVGVAILLNNNFNDGAPATFTGANGSNFAAGG